VHEISIKKHAKLIGALQHNVAYTTQINNPLKEKTMFDFEQQYKKAESAIKSGYNFWLDVIADAIKMYKTK
jgi:hypothetical protein